MLTYESDKLTRDDLDKMRRRMVCAECGEPLALFWDREKKLIFLTCRDYLTTKHEQIGKPNRAEDKSYQAGGRQMVAAEKKHGIDKVGQLVKYQGVTALTQASAREIIVTLWPEAEKASPVEVYKAMSICVQYGLNPLMNHVFLIPFDRYEGEVNTRRKVGTTYVTVLGIGANRLIASRKHSYSYVDDTPRLMSVAEQEKIFGAVDDSKIRFITKLKDTKTGAEAQGYGDWNKKKVYADGKSYLNEPKGTDKGNSMSNMAAIRSERQALARLYPADMPAGDIPVVDESYEKPDMIEGESRVIDEAPGEITEQVTEPEPSPEPLVASTKVKPRSEWDKVTREEVSTYPKLETIFHTLTRKQPKEMYIELGGGGRNDMTQSAWDAFLTLRELFAPGIDKQHQE